MAFGFDDIIYSVGEVAETAAETTKEIEEIIGDGVEESVGDIKKSSTLRFEDSKEGDVGIRKETSNTIPVIEGDGIPEQSSTMELPEEQTNVDDIQSEEDNSQKPFESEDNSALDDNGKPYIKDGELIPNNTYEINGVKYETDDKGRIVSAEAKVEINNSPRPSLNNRKVGGLEPGDDAENG